MLFRNCLIGSIIFHLVFLFGIGIDEPHRRIAQSKETYLQIYTEPVGNPGTGEGSNALKLNVIRPLAKVSPVVQSKPVQPQVKNKVQLHPGFVIDSEPVQHVISNEAQSQSMTKVVTLKTEERGLVDGISNSIANNEAKPVNHSGGSSSDTSHRTVTETGTGTGTNIGTGTGLDNRTGNNTNIGTGTGTGLGNGGAGSGAVSETNLPVVDVRPVKTYFPSQNYPSQARRNNWEGKTVLLVIVRSDGRVGAVEVQSKSGHDLLDQEAVRTVKKWRFQPALKDGRPVTCQVRIPFIFKLED